MPRKDRQIALWISCLLLLWSWWDFVWFADYLPATWRDALLLMAFAALAACGAVGHDWYLRRSFRSAAPAARSQDEEEQEISLLAFLLAPGIAGLAFLLLISPLFFLVWLLQALPLWLVEATLMPVVALAIGAGLARLRQHYRKSREEPAEDLTTARMREQAPPPVEPPILWRNVPRFLVFVTLMVLAKVPGYWPLLFPDQCREPLPVMKRYACEHGLIDRIKYR